MAAAAETLALASGERPADSTVTMFGVIALGITGVITLGALMGAYLSIRFTTHPWPPKGVVIQDYFGNVLLGTMVMVVIAGWWVLYGIDREDRRQSGAALGLVIFLEAAFVNLLTYMLRQAKLSPSTNAFGTLYYALNGTAIVIAATGILVSIVVLARVLGGHVTKAAPGLAWAFAWYTTFVTVAWFVVYAATYITV